MEIGESRLALDKLQMHQPAGRVVDKHQQGALRPAVFKPPVLAAVDLHQFADTLTPRARLVNPLALLAIAPQPRLDHPLAQRFTTNSDPMNRHPKHPPENPRAVSSVFGRGVTL